MARAVQGILCGRRFMTCNVTIVIVKPDAVEESNCGSQSEQHTIHGATGSRVFKDIECNSKLIFSHRLLGYHKG